MSFDFDSLGGAQHDASVVVDFDNATWPTEVPRLTDPDAAQVDPSASSGGEHHQGDAGGGSRVRGESPAAMLPDAEFDVSWLTAAEVGEGSADVDSVEESEYADAAAAEEYHGWDRSGLSPGGPAPVLFDFDAADPFAANIAGGSHGPGWDVGYKLSSESSSSGSISGAGGDTSVDGASASAGQTKSEWPVSPRRDVLTSPDSVSSSSASGGGSADGGSSSRAVSGSGGELSAGRGGDTSIDEISSSSSSPPGGQFLFGGSGRSRTPERKQREYIRVRVFGNGDQAGERAEPLLCPFCGCVLPRMACLMRRISFCCTLSTPPYFNRLAERVPQIQPLTVIVAPGAWKIVADTWARGQAADGSLLTIGGVFSQCLEDRRAAQAILPPAWIPKWPRCVRVCLGARVE